MNLDGRRVASVIGDDWILNDGGETTIAPNRSRSPNRIAVCGLLPGPQTQGSSGRGMR